MLINSMHSEVFALQNSKLSSVKKRWVIVGQPLQMDMPLSDWYLAAWWTSRKTLDTKEEKSRG